jgi:hypothetical protein
MESNPLDKAISLHDWAEQKQLEHWSKVEKLRVKNPWLEDIMYILKTAELPVEDVFTTLNYGWRAGLKKLSYERLVIRMKPFVPIPPGQKLTGIGYGFDIISKIDLKKKTFTVPEFEDSEVYYQKKAGTVVPRQEWYLRSRIKPFFIDYSGRIMELLITFTKCYSPPGFRLVRKITTQSYRQ